jgi:hypothetical protein
VLALRMAEKEAQVGQRFIWTGYHPAAPSACMRYFEGYVVEVISGDSMIVAEGEDGPEIKITLSSIKYVTPYPPNIVTSVCISP